MKICSLLNKNINSGTNTVHYSLIKNVSNWDVIFLRGERCDSALGFNFFRIFSFNFLKSCSRRLFSYDVLLVDGLINFYFVWLSNLRFANKTKIFFIIHNDYSQVNTRSRWKYLPNFFFTFLYDFILKRKNISIISCSDFTRQCMLNRGIESKSIPNGIEIVGNNRNPRDDNQNVIWYVGRLIKLKNVDLLIKSFSEIKQENYKLNIVGDGPEDSYLRSLSDELSIKVDFIGHMDDPYYDLRPGDIFVLPSSIEGRSLALMEALDRFAYIICSDIPANDLFTAQGAKLFSLSDISNLVSELKFAISLTPKQREIHARSFTSEIKKLSNKVMYEKYIEFFNER